MKKPIIQLKSRRAIWNRMKNPKYWKRPTKTITVRHRKDADRIAEAIIHYAGGAEVSRQRNGWKVHSKGYYHYIGA